MHCNAESIIILSIRKPLYRSCMKAGIALNSGICMLKRSGNSIYANLTDHLKRERLESQLLGGQNGIISDIKAPVEGVLHHPKNKTRPHIN